VSIHYVPYCHSNNRLCTACGKLGGCRHAGCGDRMPAAGTLYKTFINSKETKYALRCHGYLAITGIGNLRNANVQIANVRNPHSK